MCWYSPYLRTNLKFHHNETERRIIWKHNRLTVFADAKDALGNVPYQGMGSEKDRKLI